MEDVLLLEKQSLPVTSSEEYSEISEDGLSDEENSENSENEENSENSKENINEQFDDNKIVIINPKITHVGKKSHVIFMILITSFMVFSFIYFLPFQVGETGKNWSEYTSKCCTYIYNLNRCSMYQQCLVVFTTWVNSINKTLINVQDKCCYWYNPYANYRFQSLPYCNPKCLEHYFS